MKQINSQKQQDTLRKKFLKLGVKMSGPDTIFFSNDTKKGSLLTFWNLHNSFRTDRTFNILK